MTAILDLPGELLIEAFSSLCWRDLMMLKTVCTRFAKIVRCEVLFQYKCELVQAGMIENDVQGRYSSAECLEMLRSFRVFRDHLQWKVKRRIPVEDRKRWRIAGGVLAQITPSQHRQPGKHKLLTFQRMPAEARNIPLQVWSYEVPGCEGVCDFAIDPVQSLLVSLVVPIPSEDDGVTLNIQFLDLFSGNPHPLATKPTVRLPIRFSGYDEFLPPEIRIWGSSLGILAFNSDEHWTGLLIWNWRTGNLLCNIAAGIESFAFLSENNILVSLSTEEAHGTVHKTLRVLDITSPPQDYMPVDCEFLLPAANNGRSYTGLEIKCDQSSPHHFRGGECVTPFSPSSEHRICALIIDTDGMEQFTVFVPFSAFYPFIDGKIEYVPFHKRPRRSIIAWEDWGPRKCRLFSDLPWDCHVHEGRAVFIPEAHDAGDPQIPRSVCILDFNPWPIRGQNHHHARHLGYLNPALGNCLEIVMEPSVAATSFFAKDVVTSLPFRRVKTRGKFAVDSIFLSEDGFVVLQTRGSGDFTVYAC